MNAAAPFATRLVAWQRRALSPPVVGACLAAGAALGWVWPGLGGALAVVGEVYVELLKMIVLPFMLSAVIFSLQKTARDGGTGRLMGRVALVFAAFSVAAAVVAAAGSLLLAPGGHLSAETRALLGRLVGADADASHVEMALHGADDTPAALTARQALLSLIPSNIFASLAQAETLRALVFALLFGLAVAHVPGTATLALGQSLETVYRACSTLMRWINLPLPLVLLCMMAGQVAATGLAPMQAMGGFVLSFFAVAGLLSVGAVALLAWRARVRQTAVWRALRESLALAVATNNSLACMPAMVRALVEDLGFARAPVELLVPLAVTLLRTGAVAFFVCATLFIAALYGRQLAPGELCLVIGLSVLAGFASTGMAGVLTLTLIGSICGALGLPFEAVFVLLVAVDPLCAVGRTLVTVLGACAAVAVAGPLPAAAQELAA
jgi:Na+/H+-dicarboxylate symporter